MAGLYFSSAPDLYAIERIRGDFVMKSTVLIHDHEEQKQLWLEHWPRQSIFDEWEVRNCFAEAFNRESVFVVCRDNQLVTGMLPLGRCDSGGGYGFFPGETWHDETWLEPNRIIAADATVAEALLEVAPLALNLRYICGKNGLSGLEIDDYDYSYFPAEAGGYSGYWQRLSKKNARQLIKTVDVFQTAGVEIRCNRIADFQSLVDFSNANYGADSYFFDARFIQAFEKTTGWLYDNNALRLTTVLVGGVVAAVDLGAVWENCYSLLTGGTNREFPGIAKLINLHHLEWGCANGMNQIDFLCGDYGWKRRFGLQAVPYYRLRRPLKEG